MLIFEKLIGKVKILESESKNLLPGVLCRILYPICNCGERNSNNRIYEKAVWDKVHTDSGIQEKLTTRTLYGLAEHPKDEVQTNLEKTSHVITNLYFNESDKKEYAEFDVLDTPYGKIVDTLLRAGCQVGVSTRAEGELIEAEDNEGKKYLRVVPESYRFVTVDFTADPSTKGGLPQKVERHIVGQIQQGIESKKIDREFAVLMLEQCQTREAVALLESLKTVEGKGGKVLEGKYKVWAQAFNRETGEVSGSARGEVIDTEKNDLFKGLTTLVDIKSKYESFWNDLNPNSKDIVFVSKIDKAIDFTPGDIDEGTTKVKERQNDEKGTFISMMLKGDRVDYEDIINSRYGWAVAEQFKDIIRGEKPLEDMNSSALRLIAKFLRGRSEFGVYNQIAAYLQVPELPVVDEEGIEESKKSLEAEIDALLKKKEAFDKDKGSWDMDDAARLKKFQAQYRDFEDEDANIKDSIQQSPSVELDGKMYKIDRFNKTVTALDDASNVKQFDTLSLADKQSVLKRMAESKGNVEAVVEGKYKKWIDMARQYYQKAIPNFIPDAEDIWNTAVAMYEYELGIDATKEDEDAIAKEAGLEEGKKLSRKKRLSEKEEEEKVAEDVKAAVQAAIDKLKQLDDPKVKAAVNKVIDELAGTMVSVKDLASKLQAAMAESKMSEEDISKILEVSFTETIKKEGGKYVVYAKSGRNMGSYDKEEDAKKRLGQLEMFKSMAKAKESKDTYEAMCIEMKEYLLEGEQVETFEAWWDDRVAISEKWETLPKGWTEKSLEKFARSLTDTTKQDAEGFVTNCMVQMKGRVENPGAFCSSLKDTYLGTTGWRGAKESKVNEDSIKHITDKGYFEGNPEWVKLQKEREELLQKSNKLYAELTKDAHELAMSFIAEVVEKAEKLEVFKDADLRWDGKSNLAELFLGKGGQDKVSIHIVPPIPGSNKKTYSTLKLRKGDMDLDFVIPETATPRDVVEVIQKFETFLKGETTGSKEELVSRIGWSQREKAFEDKDKMTLGLELAEAKATIEKLQELYMTIDAAHERVSGSYVVDAIEAGKAYQKLAMECKVLESSRGSVAEKVLVEAKQVFDTTIVEMAKVIESGKAEIVKLMERIKVLEEEAKLAEAKEKEALVAVAEAADNKIAAVQKLMEDKDKANEVAFKKGLIEKYVTCKLEGFGFVLPVKAKEMLTNCITEQEVDTMLENFKDALREGMLHSNMPSEVVVKTAEVSPALQKIRTAVGSAFSGMK